MVMPEQPTPLGYAQAAKEAQSIAAPLLAGAALVLAGVIAAADKGVFYWPSVTLFLLIAASLALIASIQLHYQSRQYLYSTKDIEDWFDIDGGQINEAQKQLLYVYQVKDFRTWKSLNNWAVPSFNLGTYLLGFGIAAALLPPDDVDLPALRVATAALVLLCTLTDAILTVVRFGSNGEMAKARGTALAARAKPEEKK
jgi:hypothetical protein